LRQLRDKKRVGDSKILEIEECGLIIASITGRLMILKNTGTYKNGSSRPRTTRFRAAKTR